MAKPKTRAPYSSRSLRAIADQIERQLAAIEPRLGKRAAARIVYGQVRAKYPGAVEALRAKAGAERAAGKRPPRKAPKRGARAIRKSGRVHAGDLRLGETFKRAGHRTPYLVTEAPRVARRGGRNVVTLGANGRKRVFEGEDQVRLVKGATPAFHRRGGATVATRDNPGSHTITLSPAQVLRTNLDPAFMDEVFDAAAHRALRDHTPVTIQFGHMAAVVRPDGKIDMRYRTRHNPAHARRLAATARRRGFVVRRPATDLGWLIG